MASDLPVDIVEDIFLRLHDSADLVRASAACTSFCRVVSDGRFLCRFRSVHRRWPVLGLLIEEQHRHNRTGLFFPAQPPRRSAQAAVGFAKAADFTFSFLPDPKRWHVCDARDGRVLLSRGPHRNYMFELEDLDLAVCDPLHRQHVHIPTIPGHLLPSAKQDGNNEAMTFGDPFLMPAVDESLSSPPPPLLRFQVMCTGLSITEVVAFVFSSATGQWRRGASFNNRSTNLLWSSWCRQYVHGHGCAICWSHKTANVMLVLDTREMKFSITDLPRRCDGKLRMAVEIGDGRLGVLVLSSGYTTMHVYSKAWRDIQEPKEWCHEISIPMPGFHMCLAGAAEGYALLCGIPQSNEMWFPGCGKKTPEAYFTLEFKKLKVERLCTMEFNIQPKFLYAGFPLPLSPPSL